MRIPLLVLTTTCLLAAEIGPPVTEAEPLVDLATTVQQVGEAHYRAELILDQALPSEPSRSVLELEFSVVDGQAAGGSGRAPHWNQATHQVAENSLLPYRDGRLVGDLPVILQADRWKPADGEPMPLTVHIDATAEPLNEHPPEPNLALEGRWWRIKPQAQSAVARLSGSYSLQFPGEAAATEGSLTGLLALPKADGRWDMGRAAGDGVAFHFSMGSVRQNWNHTRLAQLPFADGPRDLSGYDGIRLRLQTDEVRHDASVTAWLREADGSWYYIKDAVPLGAAQVAVSLRWTDFEEAEWVAPGNHMDEDYRLDTSAISHLAIGVVNPLGIGTVRFRLDAIDLVRFAATETGPVQVISDGTPLIVNDQQVVPAALIGGYHHDLPQRFRPGCQRRLHFGLTGSPTIPRVQAARLSHGDIADGQALVRTLHEAADGSPVAWIRQQLPQKFKDKDLAKWLEQAPQKDKRRRKQAESLADRLNDLIGRNLAKEAEFITSLALTDDERQTLTAPVADTVAIAERDRDLLHRALPELVAPRPPRPSEQFYIDCQGERLHPATFFKRDDWRSFLHDLGTSYGQRALAADHPAVMEFWNEPYLNWAERSRIHLKVDFFRTDLATAGGPVTVKRDDGSTDDVVPFFQWVPARDDRVSQHEGLMVIDTSAFSYWSGKGNGFIYDSMYRAMASGIKAANPAVTCVAGWGFRWHEDHWGAWDILYKPTIDANIDLIDGVHEHHYQGDTTAMVGSYEVLTAYGVTAHDKWLRCYNTETNDLVDAPARGAVDIPAAVASENNKNYRRAIYNLRDILYCIAQAPAKAASRTVIHHDHTPRGTEVCYGLLADLRGRLIAIDSGDPDLWAVAAIDGTDPAAMPPEPGQKLVVMLWNDHRSERPVDLSLQAPPGTAFTTAQVQRLLTDPASFTMTIATEEAAVDSDRFATSCHIPGRSVCKITLPLAGAAELDESIQRRQFFSPDLLQTVRPGDPLQTRIDLPAEILPQARRAWLRLVVENLSPGEGLVDLGEEAAAITLPQAYTRDNGNRILMLPLAPERLASDMGIRFRVADGAHAGYRVDMASVVVDL